MKNSFFLKWNYAEWYVINTDDLRLVWSLSLAINRWQYFHVDSMYIDRATLIYNHCISSTAKPRKWNVYIQYSICSIISLYSRRLYSIIGYSRWPSLSVPSYIENHWILIEIFAVVYQLRNRSFPQSSPWIRSNISTPWIWSILVTFKQKDTLAPHLATGEVSSPLLLSSPRAGRYYTTLLRRMFSLADITRKGSISRQRRMYRGYYWYIL